MMRLLLLSWFALAPLAHAEEPRANAPQAPRAPRAATLSVGDAAPALAVEAWLAGEAVPVLLPSRVYVLDFWATWCTPCLRSAPHLAELERRYKDRGLTVIGVSAADQRGNSRKAVEEQIAKKPDLMPYRIAWDQGRATSERYLAAAGRSTLPTTFVVDREGRIAFIGHPDEVESVLADVLDGKHDLAALAAAYKVRAEKEARSDELQQAYARAFRKKDWARVAEIAGELLAVDPARNGVMAAMRFRALARELDRCDEAYAFARAHFGGAGKKDWMAMTAVAFEIVDPGSKITRRDVDYALQLCTTANELSKGREAPVLDTIARIHHEKGDLQKAVEFARQAAAIDKNLQATLERYEAELAAK